VEYLMLRAMQGDFDGTRKALEPYLGKKRSEEPLIREAVGRGLFQGGQLREAVDQVEEWLKLEPRNPRAHLLRGKMHLHSGNNSFARTSLETALSLNPDDCEVRFQLASVLLQLGLYAPASQQLEFIRRNDRGSARKCDPFQVRIRLSLAYRHLKGKEDEADACCDEALKLKPEDPSGWEEKALVAQARGNAAEALQLLEHILEIDKLFVPAYLQLSQCCRSLGRHAEADRYLADFEILDRDVKRFAHITNQLKQTPRDVDLLAEAGEIMFANGRSEYGLNYLNKALKEDPEHARSHAILAKYYLRMGSLEQAAQHLARAGAH